MAQQINKYDSMIGFIDVLTQRFRRYQNQGEHIKEQEVFNILVIYYQTTLQGPKCSSERAYCKARMEDLNSAFCEGYFKKSKH